MECPFCNINKERNRIITEKIYVYVILSNPRLIPGHLLVIPKRHVEKISELNKEEKQELFDTVIEYQEKIILKIATGCDITQKYRPFIKQSRLKVDHIHIHLLPRELNDELYKRSQIYETDIFKDLTDIESDKIIKLLK